MTINFNNLPKSTTANPALYEDDLAFKLPDDRYMVIFVSSESGYDYTIYDSSFNELDGGIYDDDSIDIRDAVCLILEDEFVNTDGITLDEIDFDEFIKHVN